MKRLNLNDLASILDATIQKGEQLEERDLIKAKVEKQNLRKSLSHDPYSPVEMSYDSEFYNPYKYSYEDGAFMPHDADYWYDQGKNPEVDQYLTVKQFYGRKVEIGETFNRFKDLRRSLENDLVKAGAVPIGTIHTYKDGQRYKKIADGEWAPVASNSYEGGNETMKTRERLLGQDPKGKQFASSALEQHASQSDKIKKILDQKIKDEETKHDVKNTAMNHVQEALKFIHGDNIPKEIGHKLNEFAHKTSQENPHKQMLTKIGEKAFSSKPHKVSVDLTINGKKLTHEFTNVHGQSLDEVRNKVQEEIKKKLPSAKVSRVSVQKQDAITPELQEKIKKLGKGQGRQVDLGEKEIKALLESGRFALISAGTNPAIEEDKKLDQKAIEKRYESLKKDLKEGGYAYSKVTGHYGGTEDSYLVMVHEADKDHIKELGKKYNQDSILYSDAGKHELHFTTGENDGKFHTGEGQNPDAESMDDYYTEITTDKGKKIKFALNLDFSKLNDGKEGSKPKEVNAISNENLHLSLNDYDLSKGGLPIGTVHTWSGQEYQKVAEGKWVPKVNPKKTGTKEMSEGKASDKMSKIEEILSSKLEEEGKRKKFDTGMKDLFSKEDGKSPKGSKNETTDAGKVAGKEPGKQQKVAASSADKKFQGTKADEGKPDNNMGPPPPENQAFIKPGKELKIEEVDSFIEKFKPDYVEMQTLGANLKAVGANHFGNRLKDKLSLYNKMQGRLKERSLNTATDVIGARALSSSIDGQQNVLKHIQDTYEIVEVEDATAKGRPDGYRAIHVLFKTETGKIAELQIKTHRQQIYSGFTHDTIYKPSPELADEFGKSDDGRPRNREVANYLNKLSDYLYSLDQGAEDNPKNRPVEPEILKTNGIEFPWHEIDKLAKEDFSSFSQEEKQSQKKYKEFEKKNKGKVKHFVVIRSPQKENMEIKEFDSFDKANSFVKKNSPKHKGEMPMGYSDSKEEFLRVFSEYRKEGW